MSVQAITWAFGQDLPSGPKFVLVALANYADHNDTICMPIDDLSDLCGDGWSKIEMHLRELEEMHLIIREEASPLIALCTGGMS